MRARAALLTMSLLLLTGCGSEEPAVITSDPPRGTNAPTVIVTVTQEVEAEPIDEPVETSSEPTSTPVPTTSSSKYPKFGETHTTSDGISLTIGVPAPYTPSPGYEVEGAVGYVAFDVLVVNGSSEEFQPVGVFMTMQSGNVEAEQQFDSAQGIGSGPSTTLLPGRETTYKIGFAVSDPADLVMEVRVGYENEVIYTT